MLINRRLGVASKLLENYNSKQNGFTVFELVVVLIGFAIVIALLPWAYSSFVVTPEPVLPETVREKMINISLLKSDISSAVSQLEAFKEKNGYYPKTNDCLLAENESNICLRPAQGSVFEYKPEKTDSGIQNYELFATKKGVTRRYVVTNLDTNPVVAPEI
jgi:type II secretory pathway pseudopilin PulG